MNQGFGTPGGTDKYKISGFEQISKKKNKQIPFQGDHSKFEFLECCLKNADDPPGGGFAPPLGDPCILSQPRNSNFE